MTQAYLQNPPNLNKQLQLVSYSPTFSTFVFQCIIKPWIMKTLLVLNGP